MSTYGKEFYESRDEKTRHSAKVILSIVQELVPDIDSAVDLGCGVGAWLAELQERGASKVCGVEGGWVDSTWLKIDKDSFIEHDFSVNPVLQLDQRFDLAISLEVAEHLPPSSAEGFVSSLTGLSDFVLFSAATPHQGGVGHLNEQWATYWIDKFEDRGYVALDVIRKRIWSDETIIYWYRQNTLLYVKKERIADLKVKISPIDHIPPEVYCLTFTTLVSPRILLAWEHLFAAIRRRFLGAKK